MQTEALNKIKSLEVPFSKLVDAFLRRLLDIVASSLGLIFLLPILALIAIFIKRDSPGPIFYRGPRVGRGGKPFNILKFRTMFECTQSYQGSRITAQNDDRITPYGKLLRDTKINELPQLWNVLVGEMSLVGPRPEDPEFVKKWPDHLRRELLSVRPGITSPATVSYRSEETMLQQENVVDDYLRSILPDKLRIDSLYVRNRTVLTDLDVIFMTFILLLPRIRNVEVPESILYWGPLSRFVSQFLNWFVLDCLIAFAALGFTGLLYRADMPLNLGITGSIILAITMAIMFSLFNLLFGLQRVAWRRARATDVFPLA